MGEIHETDAWVLEAQSQTDVLRSELGEHPAGAEPGTMYVVNPSASTVECLFDALGQPTDDQPDIRILAEFLALSEITGGFRGAAHLADHLENGSVEVRTFDSSPRTPLPVGSGPMLALLLTSEALAPIVDVGAEGVVAFRQTRSRTIDSAIANYREMWDEAAEYQLLTPPYSEVKTTMTHEFGPQLWEKFEAIQGAIASNPAAQEADLDEVDAAVLAAASRNEQQYEVGRWSEGVGLGSKATFSRAKTRLEDVGVISTASVPQPVGRPRNMLQLDGVEGSAQPAELVDEVAETILDVE